MTLMVDTAHTYLHAVDNCPRQLLTAIGNKLMQRVQAADESILLTVQ